MNDEPAEETNAWLRPDVWLAHRDGVVFHDELPVDPPAGSPEPDGATVYPMVGTD